MNFGNQSKISMINCVIDRIIEYIEALKSPDWPGYSKFIDSQ